MSLRHLHRPGAKVVNLTRLHSVYGIGAGRCRQPCPQWDKANGMKEEEKKEQALHTARGHEKSTCSLIISIYLMG